MNYRAEGKVFEGNRSGVRQGETFSRNREWALSPLQHHDQVQPQQALLGLQQMRRQIRPSLQVDEPLHRSQVNWIAEKQMLQNI